MPHLANLVRSKSDPKIIRTGPSSFTWPERIARNLGWMSIALGAVELFAPRHVTGALGMQGKENLVRAYGVRGIATGIVALSPDKAVGMWGRVAGDALDIATLIPALHSWNPKRDNVKLALAAVLGITIVDAMAAGAVSSQHRRKRHRPRSYADRSGFPGGIERARSKARASARSAQLAAAP